ncbi:MAG: PAS domain S-box protein [Acidobacteria bacterium]|nr:PAS domain S-box protein [Acidobacteriota bacterium]
MALLLVQPTRDGERTRLQQSLNVSQRSLQDCENRSQAVFQSNLDGMVLMDDKGYIQQFSPSAERVFGISSVDITGQSIFKLLPNADRNKLEEQFRKLTPTRDLGAIEVSIQKADGSEQKLELTLRKSVEGRMLIALFRDRSVVSNAEEGLRRDIGFLAAILDAARAYLVILDRQGRILRCNRASEVLAGRPSPELRGRHFAEVFAPRQVEAVRAGFGKIDEGQVPEKLEEACPSAIGERIVSWTNALLRDAEGKPEYVVVTGADVTDLRRQAVAAAKPERGEVNRITGELALNLGNLLTNVSGYADLVLATMPAGDPSYCDIQQIKESGDRASSLVRKLLAFAGRNTGRPKMIDLNTAAAAAARQQADRLGERIELHMELAPQSPQVLADGAQLEEIVAALFDNARDAMPNGGVVALRTAMPEGEGEGSQFATISVVDSGRGLKRDEAGRMFEPFFTTKEPGKGAGLSLAAVRGMLQQTGGSVRAQGEPGKGTTVEILLPLASRARGPVLVEKTGARR